MLETHLNIEQISSSGYDFWITDKQSNNKALLEVHCKQMNKNEAKSLDDFNKGTGGQEYKSFNDKGFNVRTHVITPCGKPKRNENIIENTTENVISKIAAIKQEEHQLSNKYTSLLWLDFQDETWDLLDNIDLLLPCSTHNGAFFSGGIWYAFYGWKDAPILEHFYLDNYNQLVRMRHNGRFLNSTKLDAVIISFPQVTVVMENPYSTKPIKPWLWNRLIDLPWLKIQYSHVNWFSNDLQQQIELEQKKLIELSKMSPSIN